MLVFTVTVMVYQCRRSESQIIQRKISSENLLTSWKMTLIQVLTSSLPPIPADLGNATIYKQQHEGSACFRKS